MARTIITPVFYRIDMDKFDRIQQLHRLFKAHRRPIPLARLADRMECSEKTVKRTIETMQNFLDAPIEYFTQEKGWQYSCDPNNLFELPGFWLTGQELQSLTLLLHVMADFGNGLLNEELVVIERQIGKLLQARGISPSAFTERIKVLPMGNRQVPGGTFQRVGDALLERKQLSIRYQSYNRQTTQRTISPQTLVYYRENWYLDAWCHLRDGLRTFSLARIARVQRLNGKAKTIPRQQLHEYFAKSYGIFAGKPRQIAKLRFFSNIAREIAMQQWHPDQCGQWDGKEYVLTLPCSDDRELVGDILRHSPNVVVEAPARLRDMVCRRLKGAVELYG